MAIGGSAWLSVLVATAACVSMTEGVIIPSISRSTPNWCPLIWTSAEYNVVMIGPEWPPAAGCAVKRYDQIDLWLKTPEDDGGKGQCGSLEFIDASTKQTSYDCLASWKVISVNGYPSPYRNLSYMFLHDQAAAKEGKQSYRCAAIESLLDGDKYRMAISATEHCDDLLDILINPKYSLPTDKSTSDGRTTVLLLYRNFPQPLPNRQRRDTDEQCRFSDFAQGEWLDLRVDGNAARYVQTLHNDEVDDDNDYEIGVEQQDVYGMDGDAETGGGWTRVRRNIDLHAPLNRPTASKKSLSEWDLVKRMEWQWLKNYGSRSRAFLNNDISAKDSPISTPPPSSPPTPPRSGSNNTFHPIYNQLFEAKDVVDSFNNLIDEYKKLIDNDEKKQNLNNEDSSSQQYKGAKFLTWGGRVKEEHVFDPENTLPNNDNNSTVDMGGDSVMGYGCLWFMPRGPNVMEFSVVGTGMPKPNQDLASFARELCKENTSGNRDVDIRKLKNLRPRRQWWFTEPRTSEKSFVPVACPVLPGTIFYGIVPAPPPPSPAAVAAAAAASVTFIPADPGIDQLCAKLVSSVDDLTTETPGSVDYMRYTISVCVNQDPAKNRPKWTPSPLPAGMIFEDRKYQCLSVWSEQVQRAGPPTDDKPLTFTYTYVKRVNSVIGAADVYECFVSTTIPNDPGHSDKTTTTILLTEAGVGTRCSRLADPYRSGMKLVGTRTTGRGATSHQPNKNQDSQADSAAQRRASNMTPAGILFFTAAVVLVVMHITI